MQLTLNHANDALTSLHGLAANMEFAMQEV